MRYVVNGKPVEKFNAKNERDIRLARQQSELSGSILTSEAATQAYTKRLRWLFGTLMVVAVVVIGGLCFADPADASFIVPCACVIALLLAAFLLWRYRSLMGKWNSKIAARMAALARPGSPIKLDDANLTLGTRIYPWPSLAIDAIELSKLSDQDGTTFFIDRLLLNSSGEAVALDAGIMQEGRGIVDNAYRRLRPATP